MRILGFLTDPPTVSAIAGGTRLMVPMRTDVET
jgi:hypothetical protein